MTAPPSLPLRPSPPQHILSLEGAAASVKAVDVDGRSAAHLACEAGHAAVAQELLNGGADLRLRDGSGTSALQLLPPDKRQQLRALRPL